MIAMTTRIVKLRDLVPPKDPATDLGMTISSPGTSGRAAVVVQAAAKRPAIKSQNQNGRHGLLTKRAVAPPAITTAVAVMILKLMIL